MTKNELTEVLRLHRLWLNRDPSGTRADLTDAVLTRADLTRADLTDAVLTDAVLRGADLTDAVLTRADLTRADLTDADLTDADLRGAVLRGADLRDADLRDAVLTDADLTDAVLTDAVLTRADLRDAVLTDADLTDADLTDADLRGAVLRGAPVVPRLHSRILEAIEAGGTLDMGAWHTCETTHCRAGWAVVLAGPAGAELEKAVGPAVAGALISVASCPALEGRVPDFYASNSDALADIRRLAALETP